MREGKSALLRINQAHGGFQVNGVAFADTYSLLSCGNDFLIKLFDIRVLQRNKEVGSGKQESIKMTYEGHTSGVRSVAVTGDGASFASVCADGSARLWRLDEVGLKQKRMEEMDQKLLEVNSEYARLSSARDAGLEVDIQELTRVKKQFDEVTVLYRSCQKDFENLNERGSSEAHTLLVGHTDAVSGCSWQPTPEGGALLLTSSWDQTVRLWEFSPEDMRRSTLS